jgi:hypothetical protein
LRSDGETVFVSAFQAHVERMEKEATLSEEIPAKRERKHSSNTSNPDAVDVKNGHTHEVGKQFLFFVLIFTLWTCSYVH